LYRILYLKHPFEAPNKEAVAMMFNVVTKEIVLSGTIDEELSSIIKVLLDKDPAKRPSTEELI